MAFVEQVVFIHVHPIKSRDFKGRVKEKTNCIIFSTECYNLRPLSFLAFKGRVFRYKMFGAFSSLKSPSAELENNSL